MMKCDFNKVAKHLSEHLFLRTRLEGCFWSVESLMKKNLSELDWEKAFYWFFLVLVLHLSIV